VEELQAGWVGEVGCVSVEREREVGVCCVDGLGFGGEVPETAVLCWADERDAFEELLCRFGGWGHLRDEAESGGTDLLEE